MGIEEFRVCCNQLHSEKSTERKRGADRLKSLLNNDNLIHILNLQSKGQEKQIISWNQIFLAAKFFLLKESEKVERDERNKENPSQTVRSNWANTRKYAASLVKFVLKVSSRGGPKINLDIISEVVFTILSKDHPYLLEFYTNDALIIIQKYILVYPQYYMHMTTDSWKDLIRICIWIYENNVQNADLICILNTLESVLKIVCFSKNTKNYQPSLVLGPIANFICRAFEKSSSSSHYGVKGALVSLLDTFSYAFGSQWRRLMCKLGEMTYAHVLSMWENKSSPRQIRILQYFSRLLIMHNPQQDGLFLEENSYSFDRDTWQKCLCHLYLAVHECLREHALTVRMAKSSGVKINLPEEFVRLAARLCSLVFNEHDEVSSIDVTQINSSMDSTQLTDQPKSKKRRIEVGFRSLCEELKENGTHESYIPWYQILSVMLRDHGQFFCSKGRADLLLDHFLQLLPQTKNNLVLEALLSCLIGLMQPRYFPSDSPDLRIMKAKWAQISDFITRVVAGRRCLDVGMNALRALIEKDLTYPQNSLYQPFAMGILPLNEAGIDLLRVLLTRYTIPKTMKTQDYLGFQENKTDVRISFIKRLLPLKDDLENSNETVPYAAVNLPLNVVDLLLLLRLQNPLNAKRNMKLCCDKICDSSNSELKTYERELEEMYLNIQSSLKSKSHDPSTCFENQSNSIADMDDFVYKRLCHFIKDWMIPEEPIDEKTGSLKFILMALNIYQMSFLYWRYSKDDRLLPSVKSLNCVFSYIKTYVDRFTTSSKGPDTEWKDVTALFIQINELLTIVTDSFRLNNIHEVWLRSVISGFGSSFQHAVSSLIDTKEYSLQGPSQAFQMSQMNASHNRTMNTSIAPSFDPDFDEPEMSFSSGSYVDDFDTPSSSDVADESTSLVQSAYLKSDMMCAKDTAIINLVKTLSKLDELNSLVNSSSPSEEGELYFIDSIKRFANLSSSDKSNDQIMVLAIVRLLFSTEYQEDNVEDGLVILSKMMGTNSSDSRLAYAVLMEINELLFVNGDKLIPEHKENALQLIKAFVEKYHKGFYALNITEAIFQCLLQLTLIDPERSWSLFKINDDVSASQLFFFLKYPWHVSRMKAIEAVPLHFMGESLSLQHQKQLFEEICVTACESLTVEQPFSEDFSDDEIISRSWSFLLCLASVAKCSLALENQALYAIVSSVKLKGINSKLAERVVKSVASYFKKDTITYLEQCLPYIMLTWLKEKHPIDQFPYVFFEKSSFDEFLQCYSGQLVSSLFLLDEDWSQLEVIARSHDLETHSLIQMTFASIFASILPYLVAENTKNNEFSKLSRAKMNAAIRKWKFILNVFEKEHLTELMRNSIDEVVLLLFRQVHDYDPWKTNEIVLPPRVCHISSETATFTFCNVQQVFFKQESSLLRFLCHERRSAIQYILHGLFSDLVKDCLVASELQTPVILRRSIAPFSCFVRVVMNGIPSDLGSMLHYLVKRIVLVLVYLVEKFAPKWPHVNEKCCKLLKDFIEACLEKEASAESLSTLLPSVIPRLHSLHSKCEDWGPIFCILVKIFETTSESVKKQLCHLGMLSCPTERSNKMLSKVAELQQLLFSSQEIHFSLRNMVQNLVTVECSEVTSYNLLNLYQKLKENVAEVSDLYDSKSEELGVKWAHALAYKLVAVLSNSMDSEIESLGLKCLGTLGPANLGNSVFAIKSGLDEGKDPDKSMMTKIFSYLNKLSFGHALDTVEASSEALRRILSTKSGFGFWKDAINRDLKMDLLPFVPATKPRESVRRFPNLSIGEFEIKLRDEVIWEVECGFDLWLKRLTIDLIECGTGRDFFNYLVPVCEVDTEFCRLVIPFAFYFVLKADPQNRRRVLSPLMMSLVERISSKLCPNTNSSHSDVIDNHAVKNKLKVILSIVNLLRTIDPEVCFSERTVLTTWERNLWLDLDYLSLAKAAFLCDNLFTAVMYCEIACDLVQESFPSGKDTKCALEWKNLPPLQRIAVDDRGKMIASHLLQVYETLGLSDGVEGCGVGISSATDPVAQASLCSQRGNLLQSLRISDVSRESRSLFNNLLNCGMFNILYEMTNDLQPTDDQQKQEARAECAWRLGHWSNCPDSIGGNGLNSSSEAKGVGFNQSFLKALSGIANNDLVSFDQAKDSFLRLTLASLKESGNESTASIYPVLTNLQIFYETSEIAKLRAANPSNKLISAIQTIELDWNSKESFNSLVDGPEKERILSARIAALKCLQSCSGNGNDQLQNLIFKLLLKNSNYSNRFGCLNEAKLIKVDWKEEFELRLEEAKLAVALGNSSQATCSLKELLFKSTDGCSLGGKTIPKRLRCSAIMFYAQLLTQSRTKSPNEVIGTYYEEAIRMMEQETDGMIDLLADCYHDVASFSDRLYQDVKMDLSSEHSTKRQKQIELSEHEAAENKVCLNAELSKQIRDRNQEEILNLERSVKILMKDAVRERKYFQGKRAEMEQYLYFSLSNYLKVVTTSSKHDLSIFRLVALWLENMKHTEVNEMIEIYLLKMKSHKFIPLLYQLVARMTCVKSGSEKRATFSDVLHSLLYRVCLDHPHHALPVLLTLANSHLDEQMKQNSTTLLKNKSRGRSDKPNLVDEETRVVAAKALVHKLKGESKLTDHIQELESLYEAYIQLAYRDDRKSLKNKKRLENVTPSNTALLRLRNFNHVTPLTRPIPVTASGSYDPPLISHWDKSMLLVGGINNPIKLTLYCSDGAKIYELLKGNDDLRQDAVLEQVFSVVNEVLAKDAAASESRLSLRTYAVVPLSQKTGLIQWCVNTTTIGEYLIQSHANYYPDDWSPVQCRTKLINTRKTCETDPSLDMSAKLIAQMKEILCNLHPVFRYFFFEEFVSTDSWFVARSRYVSSVAVSSMAGFLIGLGDRHVHNILIDKSTAEVIHIDLGIAFENGKLLPTWERVPFRLTQNIIDGLGAMGIEGPLRKRMETTLRVLREAKSLLLTVIEVLKHDPLHTWVLSKAQISKLRQYGHEPRAFNDEQSSASLAERALLRVQQKLNGIDEDGHVLSVPEHVSVLIQQATDVSNLAQMFHGWQAYL